MEISHTSFIFAVALAAGVFAQSIARHLRIPGIVVLLAAGTILGQEGLGWVIPEALGQGLFVIVDFAVAVILFEGGLGLEISRLRREELSIRKLITVGSLITLLGGFFSVLIFLNWPFNLALLFGSLVVVTGPTVVTPLVRSLRLQTKTKTILEAEGVLIDPIGAILAVIVLEIVITPNVLTLASGLVTIALWLVGGLVAGVLGGLLISWLLRFQSVVPKGHENIFTLAFVVLLFEGCNHIVSQSGILGVTVAGIVVGNTKTPVARDLREFKDQLTVLLIGLLFILLAADVSLDDIRNLGWAGAGVIATLIFIVRPLNIWVSTRKSDLSFREKAFISWIAPRGIIAAAIASLTSTTMDNTGMSGGDDLKALVFLTIASTVLLTGLTAGPLASILKLRLPGRDRIAILGARGLGLLLGEEFRKKGRTVVFLDSDPKLCRQAEEAGFLVVFGNALEERTLLRARIELVGTVIGATYNNHLNSTFVVQTRTLFNVPSGYIAVDELEAELTPEFLRKKGEEILFEGPHDTDRWDVRFRHKDLEIVYLTFSPGKTAPLDDETKTNEINETYPKSGERFVILTIQRGERMFPMSLGFKAKTGDVAAVAIYIPEKEAALLMLKELGWTQTSDS